MKDWGFLATSRYLLHDRDGKFCSAFREVMQAGKVKPLKLPARSPNLNAFAKRWVRSVKEACLSRLIFFGEHSLRRALTEYVDHLNYASYCPPRYVVGNSRPCCNNVGIAWSLLLLRTRATNLVAATVSSAR